MLEGKLLILASGQLATEREAHILEAALLPLREAAEAYETALRIRRGRHRHADRQLKRAEVEGRDRVVMRAVRVAHYALSGAAALAEERFEEADRLFKHHQSRLSFELERGQKAMAKGKAAAGREEWLVAYEAYKTAVGCFERVIGRPSEDVSGMVRAARLERDEAWGEHQRVIGQKEARERGEAKYREGCGLHGLRDFRRAARVLMEAQGLLESGGANHLQVMLRPQSNPHLTSINPNVTTV